MERTKDKISPQREDHDRHVDPETEKNHSGTNSKKCTL